MAFVIAVTLPKGGVGKTTVSNALAHAAAVEGDLRVALIDHDSQGSSMEWAAAATADDRPLPYTVLVAASTDITRWIHRHGDEWDVIVIDGHPRDDDHNRAAARNAHVIVVPTEPYEMSLVRVFSWLDYCRSIGKPAYVVLNRVPSRSLDEEAAREVLINAGAQVATTELGERVGVARNYGRPPGRLLTHFGHRLLEEITPDGASTGA